MNVKAIRIYKMNTSPVEQIETEIEQNGEPHEYGYNPTDGSGMCYGDAYSMLVRLADDYYLTLYDTNDYTNGDEFEIADAYEWMGLEYREPTLIFNQDCM